MLFSAVPADAQGVPNSTSINALEASLLQAESSARRGQIDSVLRETQKVLVGEEDEMSWPLILRALVIRSEASVALGELEEGLSALRLARSLLGRHRHRLTSEQFFDRAEPIHLRLVDLLFQTSPADSQSALREGIDALEDLKVAELREYFGDICLSNLEQTTPEVLPEVLLLYPVILADRVELVIGEKGLLRRVRAPMDPADLRKTTRKLRRSLVDPTTPRYRAPAAELYDALIRPLGVSWLGKSSTLTVVASRGFRSVPFAALYDREAKAFLIEQVPVATLPTLRVIAPESIDPRRARLLAVGMSAATEGFEALPAVGREIKAAAGAFHGTQKVGDDFSAEAFEKALSSRSYDLIHIATHGRFDAKASESYLVTADGHLGMAELSEIISRSRHRTGRPIELLTLSACETALGDDRALLGLAGVAVQSGARSAIASLWRVNDEATATLFEAFYGSLARPGTTRAEALQHAQLSVLANRKTRHPVFWSAFLLINSWR